MIPSPVFIYPEPGWMNISSYTIKKLFSYTYHRLFPKYIWWENINKNPTFIKVIFLCSFPITSELKTFSGLLQKIFPGNIILPDGSTNNTSTDQFCGMRA